MSASKTLAFFGFPCYTTSTGAPFRRSSDSLTERDGRESPPSKTPDRPGGETQRGK